MTNEEFSRNIQEEWRARLVGYAESVTDHGGCLGGCDGCDGAVLGGRALAALEATEAALVRATEEIARLTAEVARLTTEVSPLHRRYIEREL